tara:strand:+ start:369 stop:650 length:282 start_codon:yes stop_codon:yes gene_type:complete
MLNLVCAAIKSFYIGIINALWIFQALFAMVYRDDQHTNFDISFTIAGNFAAVVFFAEVSIDSDRYPTGTRIIVSEYLIISAERIAWTLKFWIY